MFSWWERNISVYDQLRTWLTFLPHHLHLKKLSLKPLNFFYIQICFCNICYRSWQTRFKSVTQGWIKQISRESKNLTFLELILKYMCYCQSHKLFVQCLIWCDISVMMKSKELKNCDFEESRFSTLLAVILGLCNVYQKMLQNSF